MATARIVCSVWICKLMSWDFGDGGTSTNKDAEHIYNAAGTYTAYCRDYKWLWSKTSLLLWLKIVDDMPVGRFVLSNLWATQLVQMMRLLFLAENSGNGIGIFLGFWRWNFFNRNIMLLTLSYKYRVVY